MLDIGHDLLRNKHKIILILIIFIIIYLFTYTKIEKRKESLESIESTESEMYIPNCNFLTDKNICEQTKGCFFYKGGCRYDWSKLQ